MAVDISPYWNSTTMSTAGWSSSSSSDGGGVFVDGDDGGEGWSNRSIDVIWTGGSSPIPPNRPLLFADYPDELLHFAVGACVLFILVGVPGNFITIVALLRYTKVRNATAMFIINLSVSDLMFCCFNLPLATSLFYHRGWVHGDALCTLFPLMRYGLLAVSIFTVLAITLNRYIMIGHPRIYPKLYKRRHLILMIAFTWLGCFGSLVPTLLGQWGSFGLDEEIGSCSILPDPVTRRSPKEFLFVVAFVLPCLAIVVCYARIFFIVRQAAAVSHGRDQQQTQQQMQQMGSGGSGATGQHQLLDQKNLKSSASIRSKTGIGGVIPGEMTRRGMILSPHHPGGGVATKISCQPAEASFQLTCCESQQGSGSTEISDETTERSGTGSSSIAVVPSLPFIQQPQPAAEVLNNVKPVARTASILRWNKTTPPVRIEVERGSDTFSSSEIQPLNSTSTSTSLLPVATDKRRISVSFMMDSGQVQQPTSTTQSACLLSDGQHYLRVPGSSGRTPSFSSSQKSPLVNVLPAEQSSGATTDGDQDPQQFPGSSPMPPGSPAPSEASSVGSTVANTPTGEHHRSAFITSALSQVSGVLQRRSTRNRSGRGSGKRHPGRMTAKDRKLLQMILVIFVSFIVCYMPITVVKSLSKEMDLGGAVNIVGYILIYLTTCINPIIYVVMSSEYRQAYKNLLTCKQSSHPPAGPLPSRSFSQKAY